MQVRADIEIFWNVIKATWHCEISILIQTATLSLVGVDSFVRSSADLGCNASALKNVLRPIIALHVLWQPWASMTPTGKGGKGNISGIHSP